MNMRTIAKVALVTLSLNLCAPVSASILITEAQYQELLPKTSGAVDYTIKLATNITVNYHCEYFRRLMAAMILIEKTVTTPDSFTILIGKINFQQPLT